jgi:hypothetical protein
MSKRSVDGESEETKMKGDLATTTPGTVTNKEPLARRSMGRCSCR